MNRTKMAFGIFFGLVMMLVLSELGVCGSGEDQRTLWVASRPIAKGETMAPDSIVQKVFSAQTLPQGVIQDPAEILGMRATRNLAPGTILRRDQFRPEPVLRRGQRVQIVLERQGLRIIAPGEALEEGAIGETVKVMNSSSRQVITAKVADAGRVTVDF